MAISHDPFDSHVKVHVHVHHQQHLPKQPYGALHHERAPKKQVQPVQAKAGAKSESETTLITLVRPNYMHDSHASVRDLNTVTCLEQVKMEPVKMQTMLEQLNSREAPPITKRTTTISAQQISNDWTRTQQGDSGDCTNHDTVIYECERIYEDEDDENNSGEGEQKENGRYVADRMGEPLWTGVDKRDLRRSSSCIDYKSHLRHLEHQQQRRQEQQEQQKQRKKENCKREGSEDSDRATLHKLNTYHYISPVSPWERGNATGSKRLRQLSGKLREKMTFGKRDKNAQKEWKRGRNEEDEMKNVDGNGNDEAKTIGRSTKEKVKVNASSKRQRSFLVLKKVGVPGQQERDRGGDANVQVPKRSKRERSFLYLRRKLGYEQQQQQQQQQREEEVRQESWVRTRKKKKKEKDVETQVVWSENSELKRQVSMLEMQAFEKEALRQQVGALEHALDVVREEANCVRDYALDVLMQADPDQDLALEAE